MTARQILDDSQVHGVFLDPRDGEVIRVITTTPCVVFDLLTRHEGSSWVSVRRTATQHGFLEEFGGIELEELGVMDDDTWGCLVAFLHDPERFEEIRDLMLFYAARRTDRLARSQRVRA